MRQTAAWLSVLATLILVYGCSSFQIIQAPNCRTIGGIPGPEDFVLDSNKGQDRLIVSSQERRVRDAKDEPSYQGQLFIVPLEGAGKFQPVAAEFKGRDDYPFHPHGIYLRKQGSDRFLYVINHATNRQHSVEVYRVRDTELFFINRYRSSLLVHPNDLAVSRDGRHIYVSNDRLYSGFLALMGDFFSMGLSNVVHLDLDRNTWYEAIGGLAFANGLELDQNRLFVATTTGETVEAYDRLADGRIGPQLFEIDINSGADNLSWERPGVLNLAAHPNLYAFLDHIKSSGNHSPSELYRVYVDEQPRAERIWSDDGMLLDASSTGQIHKGRMYISQVFDPEILICSAP